MVVEEHTVVGIVDTVGGYHPWRHKRTRAVVEDAAEEGMAVAAMTPTDTVVVAAAFANFAAGPMGVLVPMTVLGAAAGVAVDTVVLVVVPLP